MLQNRFDVLFKQFILSQVAGIAISFLFAGSIIYSISAQTNTWTGSISTDWHNPCNWSLSQVPSSSHDVEIPNATNYPSITGIAHCNELTITSTSADALTIYSNTGGSLCVETTTSGGCTGTPTDNGGCAITATLTYAPSVDNPGVMDPDLGTFTELLIVVNPVDVTSISKRLSVVLHDIDGGDGGPYSVDFSNVNYHISSFHCGFIGFVNGVDLRWYVSSFGAAQAANQSNTGTFPGTATVTGVLNSDYAWCGATAVWSAIPTHSAIVRHTFSGNVTVSDGSGNSLVIDLPAGNEGVTTGSAGVYTDTWPITIPSICP